MTDPLNDTALKSRQRYRIRRYLMAVASSSLVLLVFFALRQLGMMDENGFLYSSAAMLASFALFGVLFFSGLNLKAAEPSLTSGQMACSMVVLSVAMFYCNSDGRGLILMIFLVSFIFGVLRLQTRELMYSGFIASLMYASVISMLATYRPAQLEMQLELMRWLVMSLVLGWFAVIGGYISKVRKRLGDNNVELEKALQTIRSLAIHDALTGLPNRRHLEDALQHEKSQSSRSQRDLCVCIADLDLFKSINDTYGHEGGDDVLKAFSARSAAMTRKSDHFGRWGGEEFLGILTCTDLAGATIWAEHLRRQAETLVIPGLPENFRMSISIGIAQYQADEDIHRTLSRADHALYRAKAEGRNRVVGSA
ncbi:MAG: GGDEF domain-containing protein [Sterolibacterium sp.]|jgi:diguanylate cyclase (GGDEF)-like protein|nr:GGDEF domain-containing protein [Sterolibacterium sp.]